MTRETPASRVHQAQLVYKAYRDLVDRPVPTDQQDLWVQRERADRLALPVCWEWKALWDTLGHPVQRDIPA